MSSTALSVKRQNHRVHPCDPQRKEELLNLLIAQHPGESILVVTSEDPETLSGVITAENVTVASDAALTPDAKTRYDLLISYDLPENAAAYMTRLAQVRSHALVLLDPAQQNRLYPIETFLGRTILQETVEGFEIERPERRRAPSRGGDAKRGSKPRRDGAGRDEEERKRAPRAPQRKKGEARYLGKDENGKPLFSGKSGERNHRHDGTPKSDEEKRSAKRPGGEKKRNDKKPRFHDAKKGAGAQGKKWDKPGKPRGEGASHTKAPRDDAKKSASKRPPRRIPLKKSPKESGQ